MMKIHRILMAIFAIAIILCLISFAGIWRQEGWTIARDVILLEYRFVWTVTLLLTGFLLSASAEERESLRREYWKD